MIKELDLLKIWEIMDKLSKKQSELEEHDTFVSLLGASSDYHQQAFDSFLDYYSFKIEGEHIVVFNTDPVPYEDYYNNEDYSYIPIPILGFGEKELENYIEQTIKMQLEEQETNKIAEKEEIKRKIESLTKQLEEY